MRASRPQTCKTIPTSGLFFFGELHLFRVALAPSLFVSIIHCNFDLFTSKSNTTLILCPLRDSAFGLSFRFPTFFCRHLISLIRWTGYSQFRSLPFASTTFGCFSCFCFYSATFPHPVTALLSDRLLLLISSQLFWLFIINNNLYLVYSCASDFNPSLWADVFIVCMLNCTQHWMQHITAHHSDSFLLHLKENLNVIYWKKDRMSKSFEIIFILYFLILDYC